MKKNIFITSILLILISFSTVYGKTISTQKLNENLSKYTVIDVRGKKAYLKGHIPGSSFTSWTSLSNMKGKNGNAGWGDAITDKTVLTKKFQELGVIKGKPIVVYGDALAWGEDARIWWVFKLANIDDVYILEGGINKWNKESLPIKRGFGSSKNGDIIVKSIDKDVLISTADLNNNLTKYKVIDTRSPKEYNERSLYGEVRDGHIPTSINIDYKEFRNEDGIFISPKATKDLLGKNGINKEDSIIVYCTAGVRAAMVYYVIDSAGYKVKNYDDGFARWAGEKELPIVK